MPSGVYKRKKKMSDETKRKISLSKLGVKRGSPSKETRKKLSNANKGKVRTKEMREKYSRAKKGVRKPELSAEHRRKLSEANKGSKSYLWKGGITPINQKIRKSVEYKLWREAVFKRDKYTCIWCGAKSKKGKKVILNSDHIKPFAYFPELRFAIDNGRTLCRECHKTTETYKKKLTTKQIKEL